MLCNIIVYNILYYIFDIIHNKYSNILNSIIFLNILTILEYCKSFRMNDL